MSAQLLTAIEEAKDLIELLPMGNLRLRDRLQISFDLIEPNALTEHTTAQRAHVLADIVEHRVDGVNVGFRHAGSVRHQREAT